MAAAERRPLAVANWKMHKTLAEAGAWVERVGREAGAVRAEIGVAAPFVHLAPLAPLAAASGLLLAAQNCHEEPAGAYTGEVAAEMVRDAGAGAVVLGHSERRRDCGETDARVRRKLEAALRAGLQPIVCVGESLAERERGEVEAVLERQIAAAFAGLEEGRVAGVPGGVVLAYEPVWAIGTGRNASGAEAEAAIAEARIALGRALGEARAARTRILYGGSVTAGNAAEVLAGPSVDGALVGGGSLDAAVFLAIVRTLDAVKR